LKRALLLIALALLHGPARGQPGSSVRATRTRVAPVIDGQVDDPAWAAAAPFTAFVESFPREGTIPADVTELRVLYDDDNAYVAFVCHDARPEGIVRRLGPRDAPPVSDTVEIAIDVARDRRTAYLFGVNAGGVLYDQLLFADDQAAPEWDAVWDARVALRPDGWSAELMIPLGLFRFPGDGGVQRWGFLARRHLARTHEDVASVLLPRQAKGLVSLFDDLTGLRELRPRRDLELLPYLAGRVVRRPQFSDPARPQPRLTDPSLDGGIDVRAVLSRLQLNATINPDFGQVEADQIILNLTNQEVPFPEKRPFFLQGTEIFQPVPAGSGVDGGQVLFYSRRIGLSAPILGAAKLTGELGPRLSIGLLDAFVAGAPGPMPDEAAPDRRVRFHPRRPLHLGPDDEAVSASGNAAPENYFGGVLTYRLGQASTVGVRAASAVPFVGTCPVDLQVTPPPGSCLVGGGNAGAVDWSLRTADAVWVVRGQAEASQVVGGPLARTLPDGVVLARGATGWGTYVQAGKLGGEPWRFEVDFARISPTLELNGAGFLPTQNEQDLVGEVRYTRPSGLWRLHAFDVALNGRQAWSTDGRGINRNRNVTLAANALLPGFHKLDLDTGYEMGHFDIREITGRGIPFERVPLVYVSLLAETDPTQPLSVSATFAPVHTLATVATPAGTGYTCTAGVQIRPEGRLQTSSSVICAPDRCPRRCGSSWCSCPGWSSRDTASCSRPTAATGPSSRPRRGTASPFISGICGRSARSPTVFTGPACASTSSCAGTTASAPPSSPATIAPAKDCPPREPPCPSPSPRSAS
jgi:hypothetical protein